MSTTDELIANNDAYASSFDKADLPLPPAKKIAVVATAHYLVSVMWALLKRGTVWQENEARAE